jgi:hypothetical protein
LVASDENATTVPLGLIDGEPLPSLPGWWLLPMLTSIVVLDAR